MATSPSDFDTQMTGKWGSAGDQSPHNMGPVASLEFSDEGPLDELKVEENTKARGDASDNKAGSGHEKQVKPNKVYIGGLPEYTRQEDLRNCFGRLGNIVNIELKLGYGFVEFDNPDSAEEGVAKYHEGYFMGNKIRVELSHNRARAGKRSDDPGACFKCGENGHWARDCVRHNPQARSYEPSLIDRLHPSRDSLPPPRDFITSRDDPGRYPPGGGRYHDHPPLPPPGRDHRRPLTPPRDYRDHPMGPPTRSSRDYDDYRMRGPPPPPSRYDRPTDRDYPSSSSRGYPPPPSRELYDRYDRRPPVDDRHVSRGGRPRTPPGPPPLRRDDYDRPPRDYGRSDGRGRPVTPPRPVDHYPRSRTPDGSGYRRRSLSPPPRSYDAGRYSGNGYRGDKYSGQPRDSGRTTRDYHSRNGRELEGGSSYRRP